MIHGDNVIVDRSVDPDDSLEVRETDCSQDRASEVAGESFTMFCTGLKGIGPLEILLGMEGVFGGELLLRAL